jgi:hypothetical protein
MANLVDDLTARWRPSPEQIAEAEKVLAETGARSVYTLHLLGNKEYGTWHEDVVVVHLPGVYPDRDVACDALDLAAKSYFASYGAVVGGFTSHSKGEQWAVYDDITTEYPKEGRAGRAWLAEQEFH